MSQTDPNNPESYPNVIITVPSADTSLTVNTSTTTSEITDPALYPRLNIEVTTEYPTLIINQAPDIIIGGAGSGSGPGGQGPPGPRGNTGPQGATGATGPQGNTGEESLWTNSDPTLVTVGGLVVGSTLVGYNAIQILEEILYPYQPVSFSTFTVNLGSSPLELNQTLSGGAKNSSWTTSGPDANWTAGTISIVRTVNGGSSTTVASGLNYNSDPYSITHPSFQYTTPTNLTFTITGSQSEGSNVSITETYSWQHKVYWGLSSSTSISNFSGFNSEFATSTPTTARLFTGDGTQKYFYFVVPDTFTSYTSFKDNSSGFQMSFQAAQSLTVTNAYGQAIQYKYYRSTNSSASTVTILPSIS